MGPLVSIMIPSYNHEKYIGKAIESVLHQTYENFELLIADDGSKDRTAEIIKAYHDPRIRFFEYKENTCYRTWDRLRDEAKGKYIACIGSDDMMHPEKIRKQVDFLETHANIHACFSWGEFIDINDQVISQDQVNITFCVENKTKEAWLRELTLSGNHILAPSMMMDRHIFCELGGFHMDYRQLSDWSLWIKYCEKYEMHILPEKLTYYRIHPNEMGENVSINTCENRVRTDQDFSYVVYRCIANMNKEQFFQVYQQDMKNSNAKSEVEIRCEKFFLMVSHFHFLIQTMGINYYFEHIGNQDFRDCLVNQYCFGRKEFFELESRVGSSWMVNQISKERDEYRALAEQMTNLLNEKQQEISQLEKMANQAITCLEHFGVKE